MVKNKKGNTVAMIYASNGIVPSKEWEHNKYIRNNNGNTI